MRAETEAAVTHLHYVLAGHGLSNSKHGLEQVMAEAEKLFSSENFEEQHVLQMVIDNVREMQARLEVIGNQIKRAEEVGRE